jgi:prolyl 4-hydroxylase
MANCPPFEAVGTATFPFHQFYFTDYNDPTKILKRFTVVEGQMVMYYDPFVVDGDEKATRRNLESLTLDEYEKYEKRARTMRFNEIYRKTTGRDYLSVYPRNKPMHFLWPADYYGQQHWATTKETHFVDIPPDKKVKMITAQGEERILQANKPRVLQEYRSKADFLNMTLTVLSCAPRVLEIEDFLSGAEVDHIMKLANAIELRKSTTTGGDEETDGDSTGTRTSFNSWVEREKSPIVDAIYRRAADLLLLDESLLRKRGKTELPDFGTKKSISESLQLVHYENNQQYTAHHDYGFGNIEDEEQEDRYATLLLYLNDGMTGGETCFPRWENAETTDGLCAAPKKGKAVLFFSMLPDGNLDDLSQHAAEPVTDGEKWLINLWLHDPWFKQQ